MARKSVSKHICEIIRLQRKVRIYSRKYKTMSYSRLSFHSDEVAYRFIVIKRLNESNQNCRYYYCIVCYHGMFYAAAGPCDDLRGCRTSFWTSDRIFCLRS